MAKGREPTVKQIEDARDRCAQIIAKYGQQFLPIFERLEMEIIERKKRDDIYKRAVEIGTQNGTQIGTHLRNRFLEVSK